MQLPSISAKELKQDVVGIMVTAFLKDGQGFTNLVIIHPAQQRIKRRVAASGRKQQRAEVSRRGVEPKLTIATRRRCRRCSTQVSGQGTSLTKGRERLVGPPRRCRFASRSTGIDDADGPKVCSGPSGVVEHVTFHA